VRVSADRRHLVDDRGAPFLMVGDTAWFLVTNLTPAEAEDYFENRRRKGYNAILAEAIVNKAFTWDPPRNREGRGPFATPGDFSAPDETCFAHLDCVIRLAADKQMLILLFPCFLGNSGGTDGWWDEVVANGPTRCRDYGRYLGTRYRGFRNVVWVHGGDYDPPPDSAGVTNALEILFGIRDTAPAHLHTFHQARFCTAFGEPTFGAHLDLDATYSGDLTYQESLLAYNRRAYGPHFVLEATYEGLQPWDGKVNPPELVRAGAYWAQLTGATGQVAGTGGLWSFGWDGGDWRAAMESSTSRAMGHLRSAFASRKLAEPGAGPGTHHGDRWLRDGRRARLRNGGPHGRRDPRHGLPAPNGNGSPEHHRRHGTPGGRRSGSMVQSNGRDVQDDRGVAPGKRGPTHLHDARRQRNEDERLAARA
jgi:hypothetical protein